MWQEDVAIGESGAVRRVWDVENVAIGAQK